MPPIAHKLYAVGLIVIVIFVIAAWAVTAYSVEAKTIPNSGPHQLGTPPQTCTTCHQNDPRAPKIPHVAFPTCGYCHRTVAAAP